MIPLFRRLKSRPLRRLYGFRWYRRRKGGKWYLFKGRDDASLFGGIWSPENLFETCDDPIFREFLEIAETEEYGPTTTSDPEKS